MSWKWNRDINQENCGWMPFCQMFIDVHRFYGYRGTETVGHNRFISTKKKKGCPWKAEGSWMATAAPITQRKTTSLERCQRWCPAAFQCHRSAFPWNWLSNPPQKRQHFAKWIQMVESPPGKCWIVNHYPLQQIQVSLFMSLLSFLLASTPILSLDATSINFLQRKHIASVWGVSGTL